MTLTSSASFSGLAVTQLKTSKFLLIALTQGRGVARPSRRRRALASRRSVMRAGRNHREVVRVDSRWENPACAASPDRSHHAGVERLALAVVVRYRGQPSQCRHRPCPHWLPSRPTSEPPPWRPRRRWQPTCGRSRWPAPSEATPRPGMSLVFSTWISTCLPIFVSKPPPSDTCRMLSLTFSVPCCMLRSASRHAPCQRR